MKIDHFGLPSLTAERIREVLAAHPRVERAVIYGSRAKGNHRTGSDIDLTLMGEGLHHRDLLAIMDQIDDLLLPYTMDLSLYRMIDHEGLRDHIRRVGVTFFERGSAPGEAPGVTDRWSKTQSVNDAG